MLKNLKDLYTDKERGMEITMIFSIIVPIYKVPEVYLRKCIDSLLEQGIEKSEYEVILIDDGSPDKCGDICDEYAKSNENIKVIHKENAGVSVARNYGMDIAKGDYIIFVDGDDYVLKNSLIQIKDILKKEDADIYFFKYIRNDKKYEIEDNYKIIDIEDEKIKKIVISQYETIEGMCMGSPWGKVFKNKFLKDNNLKYKEGIKKAQDRVFILNCLTHECNIKLVDFTFYIYNVLNLSSICRKYNQDIKDIVLQAGKEIECLVNENEYKKEIEMMYLAFWVEVLVLDIFHKDNLSSFSKKCLRVKEFAKNEKFANSIKNCKIGVYGKFVMIFNALIRKRLYSLAIMFGSFYSKKSGK